MLSKYHEEVCPPTSMFEHYKKVGGPSNTQRGNFVRPSFAFYGILTLIEHTVKVLLIGIG